MPRSLPLSRGLLAIVDSRDYARVAKYKWSASRRTKVWYASRSTPRGKGLRTSVLLHRFILGAKPGQLVDHKNGDGLDSRRRNLRFADKSLNAANRNGLDANNKTGYRGVSRSKSKAGWRARIYVRGAFLHLGSFKTKEGAARAYRAANKKHFGSFGGVHARS